MEWAVWLADTNSIKYFLSIFESEPYFFECITSFTKLFQNNLLNLILIKPGFSILIFSIKSSFSNISFSQVLQ